MCTVTFVPSRGKIFITSNRDEQNTRLPASPPLYRQHDGITLVYPTDAEKGGTWIAMKENGDAAVLLNGGFIKHSPGPAYRKSRGLIIPEVLAQERPSVYFSRMLLAGVEPFTLILFETASLFEMRWDGQQKHCRQLVASRPHIWSSATLYDMPTAKKREHWFASFLNKGPVPTQQDILHFHQTAGEGDPGNDLLMSRDGIYSTVSTTSILLCEGRGSMIYLDHRDKRRFEKKIELNGTILAA